MGYGWSEAPFGSSLLVAAASWVGAWTGASPFGASRGSPVAELRAGRLPGPGRCRGFARGLRLRLVPEPVASGARLGGWTGSRSSSASTAGQSRAAGEGASVPGEPG